ncbi:MAG: T9SS type A sorting domain-containing protein [Bacteroidales bacterium]|nr:T9SS type A sorting domain-containing protein [Bacteroidales bacterium]
MDSSNIYDFDVNDDGIIDFLIIAKKRYIYHFITYSVWISSNNSNQNLVVGACNPSGAYGVYYNTLNINDTLNDNNHWGTFNYFANYPEASPMTCFPPVGDFYIGLKIYKNADTLYGWARCSATDSSVTVKDYAYNSIPNLFILVGQTVLDSALVPLFPEPTVFLSQNKLVVALSQYPLSQGEIKIVNSMGQIVKSTPIQTITNYIPITGIAQGIYIIQINTPQGGITKKVFLQEN